MPEQALAFLNDNRIGVFSVQLPDGGLHAAAIHVAFQSEPASFIILTSRKTKKAGPLLDGREARAALVIGTDESKMQTLQLHGTARLTDDGEHKEAYFAKFPEKREWAGGPDEAFIAFTPTWWRYSDLLAPGGRLVLES